ncbi:hypothetical protein [Candidatus Xenohaliotis californiensis]
MFNFFTWCLSFFLHIILFFWLSLSTLKHDKNGEIFPVSNAIGYNNATKHSAYMVNILSDKIVLSNNTADVKEAFGNILQTPLQNLFISNSKMVLNNIATARTIRLERNKGLASVLSNISNDNEQGIKTSEYGSDDSLDVNAYTKQLSIWVANHLSDMNDMLYSNDSYGVIKIKLSRSGALLATDIFMSTGYVMIDDILLASVKKYDPLPSVPEDYMPEKSSLDFLIPVHLKTK